MPADLLLNPIRVDLGLTNTMGLHARPAPMFVRTASKYDADVFGEKDGERVLGKSILDLMILAAGQGSRLQVEACGRDARKALAELEAWVANKFGEA